MQKESGKKKNNMKTEKKIFVVVCFFLSRVRNFVCEICLYFFHAVSFFFLLADFA